MKYITSIPSIERFLWEAKTYVLSLKKLNVDLEDIIILTTDNDMGVVEKYKSLGVNVFYYNRNEEADKSGYIPSLKPYLFYRFLQENKEYEIETFFYHDSDVVFLDNHFEIPNDKSVFGSDTNGYLNYDYLKNCSNMDDLLPKMLNIVGISEQQIKDLNNDSVGAQYIIAQPTEELFEKIFRDSIKLWKLVEHYQTDFQKWVVEMVSTLWNFSYFGYDVKLSRDLDFAWSTDLEYHNQKILHNAGVVDDKEGLFFKGTFLNQPKEKDLLINSGKLSDEYVKFVSDALYGTDRSVHLWQE